MSDEPTFVEVTLGRLPLKVPLLYDEDTTRRIAEEVNTRLADIESHSRKTDTQAFALLAAMSFASELEEAKRSFAATLKQTKTDSAEKLDAIERRNDRDTRDILVALDRIADSLRELIKTIHDPAPDLEPGDEA